MILTGKNHRQIKLHPAVIKSKNMGIWIAGTSNQLFVKGC